MEQLTEGQNIVVGCIAGCIQCILDHPLITWKNMAQQSLPFSMNPRIVYRGLIADMIGLTSLTATQFFSTGAIKHLIIKHKHNSSKLDFTLLTHNQLLISSFLGGVISGIAISPWELIMVQQQRYGGYALNTLTSVIKEHGIRKMSRAMVPAMGREGIFTMGYLGIEPMLEHYHDSDEKKHGYLFKFGCAMIAGLITTTFSHPFDTVKTCMQGDLHQRQFGGLRHTVKFLYTTYGIRRMYSGFTFRFGTVAMSFFVFNRVMEFVAPKLYYQQFQCVKDDVDE